MEPKNPLKKPGHLLTVTDLTRLAKLVERATDQSLAAMQWGQIDDLDDFRLATDALQFCRVLRRRSLECGQEALTEQVADRLAKSICALREYEREDFDLVVETTVDRVRFPFGMSPLQLALHRSRKRPLRLLSPKLSDSDLLRTIAGIARDLQNQCGERGAILLPISKLRELLGKRKVVVGAAVQQLVKHGVLQCVDQTYHTGRARQFRFVAREGHDYELIGPAVASEVRVF